MRVNAKFTLGTVLTSNTNALAVRTLERVTFVLFANVGVKFGEETSGQNHLAIHLQNVTCE